MELYVNQTVLAGRIKDQGSQGWDCCSSRNFYTSLSGGSAAIAAIRQPGISRLPVHTRSEKRDQGAPTHTTHLLICLFLFHVLVPVLSLCAAGVVPSLARSANSPARS